MQGITAVVAGVTGLIGQQVLEELLKDESFVKVKLIVRRPIEITHPKVEVQVVNFEDERDVASKMGSGQIIFCCVGTTRKKVKGDKTAYRKVDYDIPMSLARIGSQNGFSQYVMVSAVGANAFSGNFYLQLKGSVEEDIMYFPYKTIHIFRPSMLLGKREEFRLGETIAKPVSQAVSFLLMGTLSKYKPIYANSVARAMIAATKKQKNGVEVYEYDEMKRLLS
jgi:uncharacterized protein YbjT (DUF2867 family)